MTRRQRSGGRREDAEVVVANWRRDEPDDAGALCVEPIELDI
jgi:hypothetical protein